MIGDTCVPRQCSKENPRQPKLTGGTNYEKMNAVVRDSMIGYVFKEKNRLRKTSDGGCGWPSIHKVVVDGDFELV